MSAPSRLRHHDALIIGAGLSGLAAAAALAEAGARVSVVAKGGGYLHFTSGCVDVLGRGADGEAVDDPFAACGTLIEKQPLHPYALAGVDALTAGVELFRRVTSAREYRFVGDLRRSLTLPTALGSTRVTCLAPTTMAAGDVSAPEPMLIVGFTAFRDFYPPYVAANLSARLPVAVRNLYLDLPVFRTRRHLLSLDVARAFDDPLFRSDVARQVRSNLGGAGRVGFPAVLGLERSREAAAHLAEEIGVPVFEIPTLPPSVAGIRVHHAFRRWLMRHAARVEIGFWVTGRIEGARVSEIVVESAGHQTSYTAETVILATGGVGGGGIVARPDGTLLETAFGLPVDGPRERAAWFRPEFVGPEPQPISLVGLRTDERLRPVLADGRPLENLFVTASNLPGWDPTREGSGEGVALATAWAAARQALGVLGREPSPNVQPAAAT